MEKDIWGNALSDYMKKGRSSSKLETLMQLPGFEEVVEDEIPLEHLFRSYDAMPVLECTALKLCHGKVLDVGAGAGSHSLYLQEQGLEVTALDNSEGAVHVCKERGVKRVVHSNLYDFDGMKFDTLLLLMNGAGLAGTFENLDKFLGKLISLLDSGGQILLDSSDIIYMYPEDGEGGYYVPGYPYYGQVHFTMSYNGEESDPFPWLYLDFNTLQRAAAAHRLECEMVAQGPHFDYLAKLTKK